MLVSTLLTKIKQGKFFERVERASLFIQRRVTIAAKAKFNLTGIE